MKMPSLLPVPVLVCLLTLAACAGTPPSQANRPPSSNSYEALAAKAQAEIQRAAKTGFLWLHTEKMLAESRKAHAAGDAERAKQLAQQALDQALLAQQQAAANANAKANFTIRQ